MAMAMGLIGKKRGMTRIFTADGESIPVTVIIVEPNIVTQVKSLEQDGYRALQVATGAGRPIRVTKSLAGQYAKSNVAPGRKLREFRVGEKEVADAGVATAFKVDLFKEGQLVDVTGVSMGKGFAGTIKRHHFTMGDATHGNSRAHRAPGSIGQRQTPGRVFKGKKMAGHLGNARRTAQNLVVVRVDVERNVLLVKGAVPGSKGGDVIVRPAAKSGA
jgi:large subunit ribosomal protein L3